MKNVVEMVFRCGQWRPTAAPSPFLLKGARAKALSFAFLSLHLFLTIFARVQSRLLFQKNSLLALLSLSAFLGPSYLLHLRPFLLT